MKKILLLLLSLLLMLTACDDSGDPNPFSDATTAAFQTSVDNSLAAATYKSGISVAVYKGGNKMWTYAAGTAETGVDMTTSTPAYAYSITKTMVSALILTQIENGLYSLTDTVADLLATQADYSSFNTTNINVNATVEQLLKHTSGMPDYASNLTPLLAMCNPLYTTWKPADIITNIVNTPFAGNDFEYSNTNYILLGMIAEHKGGKTLNTLLSDEFFSPLCISASLAPQDAIPYDTMAHPYDDAVIFGDGSNPPPGTFMDLTLALLGSPYPTFNYYDGVGRGTWAAGGIISTADQLARWGKQLYDDNGYAVTAEVRASIINSAPGDDDYGYGVGHDTFTYVDGTLGELYGHGGSAPGYKNILRYEKNQRITVAIMTNANNSFPVTLPGVSLVDLEGLVEDILNDYKTNN